MKMLTQFTSSMRLGMNEVILLLPCMPYGMYMDNFAFILYVYGNSRIERGSVVRCRCSV
jgi:hypothetical protein